MGLKQVPSHPISKAYELIMTTRSGHFWMHYNINNIIFNFKLCMSSPLLGSSRMAKSRPYLTVILAEKNGSLFQGTQSKDDVSIK